MIGKNHEKLELFSKLKAMYMSFYPCLKNFPRNEQNNGIVNYIDANFNNALVAIMKANSIKSKKKFYLEEAESELLMLLMRLQLSLERQYITEGHYSNLEDGEMFKNYFINIQIYYRI